MLVLPVYGVTLAFCITAFPFESERSVEEATSPTETKVSWVSTTVTSGATATMTTRPNTARNRGRLRPPQIGTARPKSRIVGIARTAVM